jgi:hypothetical protein
MLNLQTWKHLWAAAQLILAGFVAWELLAIANCIGEHVHRSQAQNYSAYDVQAACFRCVVTSGPFQWFADLIGNNIQGTFIVVSAIATAFIARFTFTLQRATKEIGDRQVEETRILQRAYISVKPLGINPFISERGDVPDKIVGHVAFLNVGRLPARNVSVERASMKWSASDDLREADLPITIPIRHMNIVLPPGTEMRHGTDILEASELDRPGYLFGENSPTQTALVSPGTLVFAIGIHAVPTSPPLPTAKALVACMPAIITAATTQTRREPACSVQPQKNWPHKSSAG